MYMDFRSLYEDMVNKKVTMEEASEAMTTSPLKDLVQNTLDSILVISGSGEYNDLEGRIPQHIDINELESLVKITQFIYNNGGGLDAGLSDTAYDIVFSYYDSIRGDREEVIGAPVIDHGQPIVHHKYKNMRGTLAKVYYLTEDEERKNPTRQYLDEWIRRMEDKIFKNSGKKVNLNNEEVYVFPKFDGLSGIFEYDEHNDLQRVLTRGDTDKNEAEDMMIHFRTLPGRVHHEFRGKPYALKTEIMMTEGDLKKYNGLYNANYKNSRSATSSIVSSKEFDSVKSNMLHVVPLRVGLEDGSEEIATEAFEEYPFIRCQLKDRDVIRNFANNNRYVHGKLRTDGAVIHIINPELQKILGRENDKNNFEVAYKFTEESALTKILDVKYQLGLFGNLTPVAEVEPVKLKGNTINKVSLGSFGRFKDLKLGKGDTVKILYDIIPYLIFDEDCSHNGGQLFEAPTVCPRCGSELTGEEVLQCTNEDCECRAKGRILNYLSELGIKGISYATIDKLYDIEVVTSILDLYKLDKHIGEIMELEGIGENLITSWINEINSHMETDDYRLLGAIGIKSCGTRVFKKITKIYGIDDIIEIAENKDFEKLIAISGIGDATADLIIKGIHKNRKLIEKLQDILIIHDSKDSSEPTFSVCFTNIRDSEAEDMIRANGGTVADSVTKTTTYLVVPKIGISSSKVSKAEKYNIPIVTLSEFKSEIIKKYMK